MKMYREQLISGGVLVVNEHNVRIEYFFEGPDRRYGGVRVNIPGSRIEEYITAWTDNFERYRALKDSGVRRNSVETGAKGMVIRNGAMGGVYLKGMHMRIVNQAQLDQIISDYRHAVAVQKELSENNSDGC